MIRRPRYSLLTAEYEVFEEESSQDRIGYAAVVEGVVEKLAVKENISQAYTGQILSTLVTNIVTEADRLSSNLSIKVVEGESIRMKRFLERFGFREVINNVMKRVAGSMRPPGVIY